MEKQDVSLLPPHFITVKDDRFLPQDRLWQSAPSAAMTDSGRIFCVYSADFWKVLKPQRWSCTKISSVVNSPKRNT